MITISAPIRRRTLLLGAVVAAAAAGCGRRRRPEPPVAGPAGEEPTGAGVATTPGASPTTPTASVEVDVDMAPARVVAVALATGNTAGVDVHQYLTGEATGRADQIIDVGAQANEASYSRFGIVHHATTLDAFERAERSTANGVTMLTVITFGWDAPPDAVDVPAAGRAGMKPGGAGTLAWFFTLDAGTGLIDGIWTQGETGIDE